MFFFVLFSVFSLFFYYTLQHTTTHYNTLLHIAIFNCYICNRAAIMFFIFSDLLKVDDWKNNIVNMSLCYWALAFKRFMLQSCCCNITLFCITYERIRLPTSSTFIWKKWQRCQHLVDLQLLFGWYGVRPTRFSLSAISWKNVYWMRSCLSCSLNVCRPFFYPFDWDSSSTWLY